MKETQLLVAPAPSNIQRKHFVKIGKPGYRVTKVRHRIDYDAYGNIVPRGDPTSVTSIAKEGLLVQVHLPHIKEGVMPRKRVMSAWEQKKEQANRTYQYLIVRLPYISDSSARLNLLPTGCRGAIRDCCFPYPGS